MGPPGIGPGEAGGYRLSVELHVRLPELDRATAERLAAEADRVCPWSNAVRGNIDVLLVVDPEPSGL